MKEKIVQVVFSVQFEIPDLRLETKILACVAFMVIFIIAGFEI